ncbi:MAG: LamG domain-containing protein [Chitinispirillaceae bacterium]|nr:LamG domain-containing protein [Chitinispirillaceae bacterium]
MNAKKLITTGLAAAAVALIDACVNQPEDVARNNPCDPGGVNWHPPTVTAMNDTTVSINDSVTITATGTDNGSVVRYVWARYGTTYADTTLSGSLRIAWPDSGRHAVLVKAIDNDGVVSQPDFCIVTVLLDPPVPNAGQDTTVSINDTVRLHGSATDGFGYIDSWAWDMGNTGTFIIMSGGETAIAAPSSENLNYRCVLRVTDDDGNTAKDTVRIIVRQDVPVANAGNDKIAGFNDTILLHGSASQLFGSIVKWEWKIGSGSWTATGGPDTTIIMPDSEQTVICSLAVTDDDGNSGVDNIKIAVIGCVSVAGLIAYWPFDSSFGNTYFDATCNGYDAIATGTGVGLATGVKGQALSCPGSNYEIYAANSRDDFYVSRFTIESWFYSNVQITSDRKILSFQYIQSGVRNGYTLYVVAGGKVSFSISDGSGSGWENVVSSSSLSSGTWYHLACTYDSAFLRVYVNGVLNGSLAYQGTYVKPSIDARIACTRRADATNAVELVNGLIDELKLYNYALPADSIAAHYNADKP